MVHLGGGFPGAALLTQLFRQLTKPMSEYIVGYAARHPRFRRRFLVGPGRVYHRLRFKLEQLKINGQATSGVSKAELLRQQVAHTAPVIKDEEAVEIGSQLMIEVVIFAILVLLMTCDWMRSQARSASLERARRREMDELSERKAAASELSLKLRADTEQARLEMLGLRQILMSSQSSSDDSFTPIVDDN